MAKMANRRWLLFLATVLICFVAAAGTWHYRSKCHGLEACAAAEAESHEREKPSEPQ